MAMTYKTTSVWVKIPTIDEDIDLWNERKAFIDAALESGKTDEINPTSIDGIAYSRNWIDEATANEWKNLLDSLCETYGFEQTTTIERI